MASIDSLTDDEIRLKLIELGYPLYPIIESTRKVLLKKLKYLLGQTNLFEQESNEVGWPTRPSNHRGEGNVSRNTRYNHLMLPTNGDVFGSGTSNAFRLFNKPVTSSGVASTLFDTSGDSPFAASQPTTAGFLDVTTQSFTHPQASTSFGAAANTDLGTTGGRFVTGTDTIVFNGVTSTIRTRYHNISCMEEYQGKSPEELRLEYYCTNSLVHKIPQQRVQFRVGRRPLATRGTRFLGSTVNKPRFDQSNTSRAVHPSLFGAIPSQPIFDFSTPTPAFSTPATQDVFSIEMLKHCLEKLEQIVRCAICLETVKPPIMQCANGHLICSECKRTLDKCPSCRASFSDNQPSRFIDQILEAVPSRCMWANCKQYFKSGDDHELFCEYRLIKCMWDNCHWSGCMSEIYRHISMVHTLFDDNSCTRLIFKTFPLDYFDPNTMYSYCTAYLVNGHILCKKTFNDPGKKLFTETFYFFPKGKPKKDIYVEAVFTSKGPRFACKIKLIPNKDALEENTIHVPWHMLPSFQNQEKKLQYNFYITEI